MNSFFSILLFSSLIIICYSATFLERQRIIPGHEKLCYDKVDGTFYKNGEEMKWRGKVCGRKICQGSSGKDYTFSQIQTCGTIYVPPECQVEVNLNLPYPHCCEKVICPNEMIHNGI